VRIRTALFDAVTRDPSQTSRWTVWVIGALFLSLLVWSLLARLDIVAVAEGRLVPQTFVKVVQPADAGILREILVVDGQKVRKGEVLIRLDPTITAADRRSAASQLSLKRLEIRRIDSQLAGRPLAAQSEDDSVLLEQVRTDGLARERAWRDQVAQEEATRSRNESELMAARETLTKLERTLPMYERSARAYEDLAGKSLVGSLEAEQKQREAVEHAQDLKSQQALVASLESTLRAQEKKVEQITSAYRSSLQAERSQRVGEVNQLVEEFRKQGFREGLLELHAPQDGVVKDLATTTIGAVVQSGTVLLSLVPEREPLRAEVYIKNEDIGFVRQGQPVRLKLVAYPFTRYGLLEGRVKNISADASRIADENASTRSRDTAQSNASVFKAMIELDGQRLDANGLGLPIVAGMAVQAEIREGQRTMLEYLLSPVSRVASEAGRER
jgi:HlyD family secretion protein